MNSLLVLDYFFLKAFTLNISGSVVVLFWVFFGGLLVFFLYFDSQIHNKSRSSPNTRVFPVLQV